MNNEQRYDHYKETNELCRSAQKQRDRYFFFMCIAIFILLLLSAFPTESITMITEGVKEAAGFTPVIGLHVILSFCWMLYLWVTLRYYQRSVYVERTYKYIESLEKDLGITREGVAYAENYPAVLNVIYWVYQWFFPIMALCSTGVKLIWERSATQSMVFFWLDAVVALIISLTTIMYYAYIHPFRKPKQKK